jgi:hypothetical protein
VRFLDVMVLVVLVITDAGCEGAGSGSSPPSERQDATSHDEPAGVEAGFLRPPTVDASFDPDPTVWRFNLRPVGDAATSCAWEIPEPPPGETLDVRRLRLVVIHDGGTDSLAQVGAAGECDLVGAWYFDDPTSPRNVILCPGTCASIDGTVALEVVAGPTPPGPQ